MKKRRWPAVVSSLVGLGLMIYLFRGIDGALLMRALRELPWTAPVGVAVFSSFSNFFKGFRFRALYPAGLSRLEHAGLVFGVYAGNILLPLRAGELLRPYFLRRRDPQLSVKALAGWTLLDKAVEAFGFGLLVLVTIFLVRDDPRFASFHSYVMPTMIGLAAALVAALFFLPRARKLLDAPLSAFSLLASLGWALVAWGFMILVFWSVAPDPRLAMPLLLAATLGAALPGLPASLGPFEAAFVVVAAAAGVTRESALARALVGHLLQLLPTLVIGGAYLVSRGIRRDTPVGMDTPKG